jgi:hypothetical protein
MPAASCTTDITAIRAAARPRTAKHADDIVDLPGA